MFWDKTALHNAQLNHFIRAWIESDDPNIQII